MNKALWDPFGKRGGTRGLMELILSGLEGGPLRDWKGQRNKRLREDAEVEWRGGIVSLETRGDWEAARSLSGESWEGRAWFGEQAGCELRECASLGAGTGD